MAKKKKISKTEINKLKKQLLNHYLKLRKENPKKELTKMQFENEYGISARYKVDKYYGTFTKFKELAETKYFNSLPKAQRALLSERKKKFDESATMEDCIEDLRRVAEMDDTKFISRTDYRNKGKYSDATWNRFFGTFQEFRRSADLELTRHQHKIEKEVARHASHDHYKKFYEATVLPYMDKYKKPSLPGNVKRIIVASDFHDIEVDDFSLAVFIDHCIRVKPDIIVFNGDIFDLYEFSRYTKDPRHYRLKERFDFVKTEIFAPLRNALPDTQIDFVAGNHEMRLLKLMADQTPNIRILLSDVMGLEMNDVFGLDDYQINWVSKLNLAAFTKSDMKNEVKKNYRVYYNCFVVAHEPDKNLMSLDGTNGHHHQGQLRSTAYLNPSDGLAKQVTWTQTPAMHVRDAEYLHNLTKWNTGFLDVFVNIETRQVIQKIHFTHDDWTVIDGVHYERKEVLD